MNVREFHRALDAGKKVEVRFEGFGNEWWQYRYGADGQYETRNKGEWETDRSVHDIPVVDWREVKEPLRAEGCAQVMHNSAGANTLTRIFGPEWAGKHVKYTIEEIV